MLIDTAIIHSHGPYDVLAQCHTVAWPNGSAVGLHLVQVHGHPTLTLRALQHDDLHWLVVDVARIGGAHLDIDVRSLPRRDTEGVISYHLRQAFYNADAFLSAALRQCTAAWTCAAPPVHRHHHLQAALG